MLENAVWIFPPVPGTGAGGQVRFRNAHEHRRSKKYEKRAKRITQTYTLTHMLELCRIQFDVFLTGEQTCGRALPVEQEPPPPCAVSPPTTLDHIVGRLQRNTHT